MHRVLAGLAAAAAGASAALAADIPPTAYKAPVTAASFSWTGCALGLNAGVARVRTDNKDVLGATDLGTHAPAGAVGGAPLGCDYQVNPWVLGVTGLLDAADIKGGHDDQFGNRWTTRTPWVGTLTARLGVTLTPMTLVYLKGGAAWTRADFVQEFPIGTFFAGKNFTRTGWAAGTGIERMVAPRWSVFADFTYMNFGGPTDNFNRPGGGLTSAYAQKLDAEMISLGVNYRFGTP